jgi:hypothetical protein
MEMKKTIIIPVVLVLLLATSALAADTSPYVIGQWKLNDRFDNRPTTDTEFSFLNPTNLTLHLEYAFFAEDGTFCGCDRDTLAPNGTVRYTMSQEVSGGQFSTDLCPTQTDGVLKSIVFENVTGDTVNTGNALQTGYQIHFLAPTRTTEADLRGVSINDSTSAEINSLHQLCNSFIGGPQ